MVMTAQFRFEYATVVAGSVLVIVLAARLLRRLWPAAAARLGDPAARPATGAGTADARVG
jgi:hypothetical protein